MHWELDSSGMKLSFFSNPNLGTLWNITQLQQVAGLSVSGSVSLAWY